MDQGCLRCGLYPAPHELPGIHRREPMRFCNACKQVVIDYHQQRTNLGVAEQVIFEEIWNRWGSPDAQRLKKG